MAETTPRTATSERAAGERTSRTKLVRVWELLSELVRVIVSREAAPSRPVAAGADPANSAQIARRRAARRRDTTMPPVWRDVQERALEARLQPQLPKSPAPAAESSAPQQPLVKGEGEHEIDWRPFLLARISDDFASR